VAAQVKPIPTGYHSVTPKLMVREVDKASTFTSVPLAPSNRRGL